MEFVCQILMKLKTSSNGGLLMEIFSHSLMWLSKHCSGHYVTTQACTLISWGCVHLRWCGALEDWTLWMSWLRDQCLLSRVTCVTKVSTYRCALHVNHWHHFIEIQWLIDVIIDIITWNGVRDFIVDVFDCGKIVLILLEYPYVSDLELLDSSLRPSDTYSQVPV